MCRARRITDAKAPARRHHPNASPIAALKKKKKKKKKARQAREEDSLLRRRDALPTARARLNRNLSLSPSSRAAARRRRFTASSRELVTASGARGGSYYTWRMVGTPPLPLSQPTSSLFACWPQPPLQAAHLVAFPLCMPLSLSCGVAPLWAGSVLRCWEHEPSVCFACTCPPRVPLQTRCCCWHRLRTALRTAPHTGEGAPPAAPRLASRASLQQDCSCWGRGRCRHRDNSLGWHCPSSVGQGLAAGKRQPPSSWATGSTRAEAIARRIFFAKTAAGMGLLASLDRSRGGAGAFLREPGGKTHRHLTRVEGGEGNSNVLDAA